MAAQVPALSDNEREAMERALVMAGVKEPELYGPFLAALHAGYYRSSEDFVGASMRYRERAWSVQGCLLR